MNSIEWFDSIKGSDSTRAAAIKAGIKPSTLATQYDKGVLSEDIVIKLAEAYGLNALIALVEAGRVDKKHLNQLERKVTLSQISEEEMLEETLRRIKGGESLHLLSKPIDKAEDELAKRRKAKNSRSEDYTDIIDGEIPLGAAASSMPNEDTLREEEEYGTDDNLDFP